MTIIYKIAPAALWREAEAAGEFTGAPVDIADGYIHFSTASQVRETAAKYFSGEQDLLLIAIDGDRIAEKLEWEPSRGGQLFPHLYATLPLSSVVWAKPLPLSQDGVHLFPDDLP